LRCRRALVAPMLTVALIAAACGGDDDDGGDATEVDDDAETADTGGEGGDDAAETAETAETADTADTDGDGGDDAGESDDGGDDGSSESIDEGAVAVADSVVEEEVDEIVRGGTLTYLLEAESDTWDIPGANCAVACITVMNTVADPLTIVNEDNEIEPFLLESYKVSDDFTTWTLTMRDGVTFHDGTPADGAALQRNLIEMASGILQGQVLWDLVNGSIFTGGDPADSIELVDDMTVRVTFGRPFATFGNNIAGRTGWLLAPSFWDLPPEERGGAIPIGTGPFMMDEWVRGEVTSMVANPDYWRTDADGEQLPYLDGIEFRPIPDVNTRRATMESGDADMNMDSFGENKEFWNGEWVEEGNGLARRGPDRETSYLMFNNSKPPFDTPEMRRALAHCTDRQEYIDFRAPGNTITDGPFAPGAAGYLEDPGFPQFDIEEGNRILDEIGRPEVINYGTTNVPANLQTAELFQDMWSTNCGLNVQIDQFEQSELITRALGGDFEVFLWRNHGQGNPGLELVWWHSRHAEGLALNFGRIKDPEIDDLLFQTWATDDIDELDQIGQDINRRFADQVYNLWLNVTEWANPYREGVHGVQNITLESGKNVQGALAGRVWLQEVWIDG
jgi:peptide/nickel transport system substrate-binding protein